MKHHTLNEGYIREYTMGCVLDVVRVGISVRWIISTPHIVTPGSVMVGSVGGWGSFLLFAVLGAESVFLAVGTKFLIYVCLLRAGVRIFRARLFF